MKWPQETVDVVLKALNSSLEGLSLKKVRERLNLYGLNKLPEQKKTSFIFIFLNQFASPLIYVLMVAALVALIFDQRADALFIVIVLLVNAALGSYQEWQAEKSSQALIKLIALRTRVIREGEEQIVDASELIPGDIVLLEAGDRVPADIRLVEVHNLAADESLLTGESQGIVKSVEQLSHTGDFSGYTNMLYAGSNVTRGTGKGIVVETGIRTEIGKISEKVLFAGETKTPLMQRLHLFATRISFAVTFVIGVLLIVGLLQGRTFFEIFFLSIALFVSVIPEGLPVAVTIALSRGAYRMGQRNVIIRRLSAVEGLGSCSTIASDKTGTLTVNKQTIEKILLPSEHIFTVSGVGYHGEGSIVGAQDTEIKNIPKELTELSLIGVLCNEARLSKKADDWAYHGDDVDLAFLSLGYKVGLAQDSVLKEFLIKDRMPLDYDLRYAAVIFSRDNEEVLGVKGAVEALLPLCATMLVQDGHVPLDKQKIEQQAQKLAQEGYRTIAVAGYTTKRFSKKSIGEVITSAPLTFLGIAAMIDPLRLEAKESVTLAQRGGVNVIMITGDHPETALSIAKQVGIAKASDEVVVGKDFDNLLKNNVPLLKKTTVFARVSPLQKLEIVKFRKMLGDFVAVTGDGVNDAPALKEAHIGVAMGSGTDIAKEVSPVVITDDNFASIVSGIKEGRTAYANIRKVVYLLISAGFAELIFIMGSVFLNLPQPLTALQILWLNFVTNGIQDVGLAFEKGESFILDGMLYSPREGIFNRRMITQVVLAGLTMGVVCLILWSIFLRVGMADFDARNYIFLFFVVLQNYHVLNCKSEFISLFKSDFLGNPLLLFSIIGTQALHILCMHIPSMSSVLSIKPVSFWTWLLILLGGFGIVVVMEMYKIFAKKPDWISKS